MKPDINEIKSTLSKKEFEKFGKFIKSPFFNSESRFVSVYDALAQGKPGREELARKIFGPDSDPGDDRFRKLVSEFMILYRRFLAECEFESNSAEQKLMLLERYLKMNVRDEFLKHADDTIKFLSSSKVKDEIYYRNLVSALSMKYSVEDVNTKDSSKDTSLILNHYADRYFTSMKLFIFQRLSSIEYTFNVNMEEHKTFFNELGAFIEKNKDSMKQNDPEIYLRYIELKLDTETFSESLYRDYLETLEMHSENLNLFSSYSALLNLLSKFINSGDPSFHSKVLEVSQLCCSMGIYKTYGVPYIDFKIIVESFISLGELDKALSFAQNNADFIIHANKYSIYCMMIGKIYFFRKEFNQAVSFLSKVSITDYIHYIEAKLISCRIEFEQGNYTEVLDTISTVKKFLKQRTEIGKYFLAAYNGFLTALMRLTKIKLSNLNKADRDLELGMLKRTILDSVSTVYAGGWLLERINNK